MSKALKQTFTITIFSYIGTILGSLSMIFFVPQIFEESPDNYGGLIVIINLASIYLAISLVSSPNVLVKFYPILQDTEREKILSYLMMTNVIGIILSFLVYYLFKHEPITLCIDNVEHTINNIFYLLLIIQTVYSFLTGYSQVISKTSIPAIIRDPFTKFTSFLLLVLLYFKLIEFKTFVALYFLQHLLSVSLLVVYIKRVKEDRFKFTMKLPEKIKEIIPYTIFTLLVGTSATLITKIDIQMIHKLIDQANVTYYTYGIFFMSVLLIPKNAINTVSKNIISRDFQKRSLNEFTPKYERISFAYLLSTVIIFIGIYINLNDILLILGPKFGNPTIKYVILILCVARVYESILITNSAIIAFSKYYKVDIYFQILSVIIVVLLNILLIPSYGIIGAALSTGLVFIINSTIRSIFVYKKYKLIPLNKRYIPKLLLISLLLLLSQLPIITILGNDFFSTQYHYIVPIMIRSLIFGILLVTIIEITGLRKEFTKLKE